MTRVSYDDYLPACHDHRKSRSVNGAGHPSSTQTLNKRHEDASFPLPLVQSRQRSAAKCCGDLKGRLRGAMELAVVLCVVWAGSTATVQAAGIEYGDLQSARICEQGEKGGMFGWSVDVQTSSSLNKTFLAIGKPWDGSVHVYTVDAPDRPLSTTTNLVETSTCPVITTTAGDPASTVTITETEGCETFTSTSTGLAFPTQPTNLAWTPSEVILDIWNSSTAFPWTGAANASAYSLFGYSVAFSPNATFLAVGIPGRTYDTHPNGLSFTNLEHHAYHGAVRVFRNVNGRFVTYGDEFTSQPGPSYWDRFGHKVLWDPQEPNLFVTTNGGYDGVSNPEYRVRFTDSSDWPSRPTTNVTSLGVYVFNRNTVLNRMSFKQYIPNITPVPFGQAGIDIATVHTQGNATVLAVRDHDGSQGLVVMYYQNPTSGSWEELSKVKRYILNPTQYPEDWFGLGLSISTDSAGRLFLVTGAPRFPKKLYGYSQERSRDRGLTKSTEVINPLGETPPRSFFGGTLHATHQANSPKSGDSVIYVTDATSPTGRGSVNVFLKREPGLFLKGFEDAVIPTDAAQEKLTYDLVGQLTRPGEVVPTDFFMDQFGKTVASTDWAIVVGSPTKECVYTYWAPIPYSPVGFTFRTTLPNNTITPDEPAERFSEDVTILYAAIGAAVALVVAMPVAFYLAMSAHKATVMSRLEEAAKLRAAISG